MRFSYLLIAIPAIDRDLPHMSACYRAIDAALEQVRAQPDVQSEFLILTRPSDRQIQAYWRDVALRSGHAVEVHQTEDYSLSARHNLTALCKKRNLALKFAKERSADSLLFVDADIVMSGQTLVLLLDGLSKGYDVAVAAYTVKRLGYPALGTYRNGRYGLIRPAVDGDNPPGQVEIAVIGCSAIAPSCFDIPFQVRKLRDRDNLLSEADLVYGEDIGFCVNCYHAGRRIYFTGEVVKHR